MDLLDGFVVTVVIPTFNRKNHLAKAVSSVVDQGIKEVAIHIFDNCSSDGTDELISELCIEYPQIRYTKREQNLGPLRNYASAIASVETPFYLPLADDDWLLPGSLRILLDTMLADDSLGAAISQTVGQTPDGREVRLNPDETWEYRRYEPQDFIPIWVTKSHFEWSSLMFRTSAVREFGGLDVETGSPSDVDLQLQLFLRNPVKMIPHRSAVYLMHPDQYSAQPDPKRALGVFRMIRKAKAFLAEDPRLRNGMNSAIGQFSRRLCNMMACELAYQGRVSDFGLISRDLHLSLPYPVLRIWFRLRYLRHKLRSFFPLR